MCRGANTFLLIFMFGAGVRQELEEARTARLSRYLLLVLFVY
jgi:hypothetical protein